MTFKELYFHTLTIACGASFLVAFSGVAHADKVQVNNNVMGVVEDHYKIVIKQEPYIVEVCKDVKVPYGQKKEFDQEGAIIGGIIGGVIGNQFGKGSGKEATTGVGALTGAIIGGNKDKGPQGYTTETVCSKETRYKEKTKEVYSHSTVTFWNNNKEYTLKFNK